MAIRNVVTRGYGNGTYSPGVAFVPMRGYSSSAVADHGMIRFTDDAMTKPTFDSEALAFPQFADEALGIPTFANEAMES